MTKARYNTINLDGARIGIVTHAWGSKEGPAQYRMDLLSKKWQERGGQVTVFTSQVHNRTVTLKKLSEWRLPLLPVHVCKFVDTNGTIIHKVSAPPHGHSIGNRMFNQLLITSIALVSGIVQTPKTNSPRIVLATVPSIANAITGFFLSKYFRAPLTIDLRDAWPDLIESFDHWDDGRDSPTPNRLHNSMIKVFAKLGAFLFNLILRRADLVVSTASNLAQSLAARGFKNVVTIRNTPLTWPPHEKRSKEYTVEDGTLNILYAGNVGRAQGLNNALQAVQRCLDTKGTIKLRIVGAGAEMRNIRNQAASLGTSVEFFDAVPYEEMEQHYDWATVALVHLRSWGPLEMAVPSKLYECMARKIPVTLSANGEAAHIVEQTGAGKAVSAMHPEQLAELWSSWAPRALTPENRYAVDQWLLKEANPVGNFERYVDYLNNLLKNRNH